MKTFCGNLPAMSVTPRRRRKSSSSFKSGTGPAALREVARAGGLRSPLRVAMSIAIGMLALGPVAGCDSAPERDPVPNPPAKAAAADEPAAAVDDDAAADQYLKIKAEVEAYPDLANGAGFPEVRRKLEAIANGAGAAPLRANAALLLGSLFETRGDPRKASGYYQHAATLVPDDAGPHMVLATALASANDLPAAIESQQTATGLDPDNLENWLALGELRMRSGDNDGAVSAYVSYELRRKGLIDGLTLHDGEGTYVVGTEERIGCANALAAAADQGTAVALVYALRTDPDAGVRAAIAHVMGLHRLDSYLPALKAQAEAERDPDAKEAVEWALTEIARAPVTMEATERPRLPNDDPRAATGELPRAEQAPVAPTEASTLAPEGAAPPVAPPEGAGDEKATPDPAPEADSAPVAP